MMKYLAILKDSWRETVDGKVFLAMMGLSLIAVVLTASLSFTPESAENGVQTMTMGFDRIIPMGGFQFLPAVDYKIENFQQTNDARKPWNGEYVFELACRDQTELGFRMLILFQSLTKKENLSDQEFADRREVEQILREASKKAPEERNKFLEDKLRAKVMAMKPEQLESFISGQFAERGNLEIKSVKMKPADVPGATRFEVTAKGKANTFNMWPHQLGLFFGGWKTKLKLPIGLMVLTIEKYLVGYVGAAIFLLISSVMTAFFIPNMLRKGTIDLLLSKPIHRWTLLLYKYVGGLLFMFLNAVVLIGGFWLVMGLRTGLWGWHFLLMIPIMTFQFAIYYAASTLAAVFTRNTIVAILVSAALWAVLFLTGLVYDLSKPDPGEERGPVHKVAKVIHDVLPRIGDMDTLATAMIHEDLLQPGDAQRNEIKKKVEDISWPESISVSLLFIVALLAISCLWFSTREY